MLMFRTWTQQDIQKAVEVIVNHKMQTDTFCDQIVQLIDMYHLNGYKVEKMYQLKREWIGVG